jgi:hypothetical protein
VPKRTDLKLLQRNTPKVRETVTDDETGDPVDLTGKTIEFYVKATDTTNDDDATILSTATGEITITDALAGVCVVDLSTHNLTAQPGQYWRRLDVVDGDDRETAIYGPMHVASV